MNFYWSELVTLFWSYMTQFQTHQRKHKKKCSEEVLWRLCKKQKQTSKLYNVWSSFDMSWLVFIPTYKFITSLPNIIMTDILSKFNEDDKKNVITRIFTCWNVCGRRKWKRLIMKAHPVLKADADWNKQLT